MWGSLIEGEARSFITFPILQKVYTTNLSPKSSPEVPVATFFGVIEQGEKERKYLLHLRVADIMKVIPRAPKYHHQGLQSDRVGLMEIR